MTFSDAKGFFKFGDWEDRSTTEVAERAWGQVTVEGSYEEDEARWRPSMQPGEMLLSICRHIDLFWHEGEV